MVPPRMAAKRPGGSPDVRPELLGHRSAETTMKYTHPADAMIREAAEAVGALLKA